VVVLLVFPGVIFGMVRGARVELTQQQVIVVAAVCFGIFWLTYLVSAVVFFCEQKGKKPSNLSAPALERETLALEGQILATDWAPVAEPPGFGSPARELCLEQLQGNWVSEAARAGESLCKKVIQIKEAKLELKAIDTSGRITLLACGDLTLQSVRPSQTLVIPPGASEPADFIVGL
jgi:hypothetical protein